MNLDEKIIEEKKKRLKQTQDESLKSRTPKTEKKEYHGCWLSKTKLHETLHNLDPTEKVIYLNLWLYADKYGHCWPSMRHQADKLNLDKGTIQKNIHSLETKGFLKIEVKQGTQGKRHEYSLLK